ncbi:MAG: ABC transporter ATP-binding protein/permease [Chloroflexi bacterium]|nr:ABC transporter ATP-binding protein/permease [Chloroflexota bacterium]MCL5273594.1 ABC transporter ATP-binding protein/permease [Chloroflexota bacterium]
MQHGSWRSMMSERPDSRPNMSRETWLRIWRYTRPYSGRIALMLGVIAIIAVIDLIPPLLARDLIDHAIPDRDVSRLSLLALGMIIIPLLDALIGTVQRWFSSQIGEGIIYDLRCEMYDHMQRMSLRFYTRTKTGEMMSRFSNDVVGAQGAITSTLVSVVSNVFTLVSTLALMLSIEWRLTVAALVVLPLLYLPARRAASILRDISHRAMELNSRMNAQLNETLNVSGALLVKVFGRQKRELDRFATTSADVRDIGIRRALVGRWFFVVAGLVSSIGSAVLFWAGGYLVIIGALSIGTIVAFISYLTRLYQPIVGLTNLQSDLAQSLVSFERVFEYLDLPIDIKDRKDAHHLTRLQGSVEFSHVSFSYRELPAVTEPVIAPQDSADPDFAAVSAKGRYWAIDDVSFRVEPGQLVALVGPSGAGKTTISYLLPRLYEPQKGSVALDGQDIRNLTLATLSEHIGLVTQETYLFHDTIRNNLLYAKPAAQQSELESACRAAYIHDVIMSMPQGYDTIVGERGYRLSGGEKQRVALARVILKNPSVLVLDEATSSLDSESEAYIQKALDELFVGRTSIVIAHRLSTILAANLILVFDQGHLVEQGNHHELMAIKGIYARLYETQFRGLARGAQAEWSDTDSVGESHWVVDDRA